MSFKLYFPFVNDINYRNRKSLNLIILFTIYRIAACKRENGSASCIGI